MYDGEVTDRSELEALRTQVANQAASLADTVNDGFEEFEKAWANSAFLFDLPTGRVVTCTFGGVAVETWTLAAPFLSDWVGVPSVAGIVEDFVRPSFITDWAGVTGVARPTETFSGPWTHAATL